MKLELRLRDSRDGDKLVMMLGERGPEIPSEVRDKVFKLGSFVRRVKSLSNLTESLLLVLFPATVNSVTWPLKQVILKEGEGGR